MFRLIRGNKGIIFFLGIGIGMHCKCVLERNISDVVDVWCLLLPHVIILSFSVTAYTNINGTLKN